MNLSVFSCNLTFLGIEFELSMGRNFAAWDTFSPPLQPHAMIDNFVDPWVFKSITERPLWKLDDADLVAILDAAPSKRERWVDMMAELTSNCLEPVSLICRDKFHLYERIDLALLDGSIPGFGRPTTSWAASPSHIFTMLDCYILELLLATTQGSSPPCLG
jgi:hypothetical protein